jgi:hypothetical protein
MCRFFFIKLIFVGTICTLLSKSNLIERAAKSQPAAIEKVEVLSLQRPEYLKPVIDRLSNTTVVRISDQIAFDSKLTELRHIYSKNQPWNADESYLLLNFKYPAALLDGRTYKFIRWVHQPSQSVWSNINSSVMYGTIANTNQFVKLDIAKKDRYTIMYKFKEYDRIDFGQWNGNLSNNDQYAALVGIKAEKIDLVVYDLARNLVTAKKTQPKGTTVRNAFGGDSDPARIFSVSMSQSGEYVVLQYRQPGKGLNRGIHLLNRQLKFVRQLSQLGGSHYDLCVNSKGSEAIVVQDDSSKAIVSVEYSTGKKTIVLPAARSNYNIHISCRNLKRPGWAYISEFSGDVDPNVTKKTIDRTFALKLDGSGQIQQFTSPNHSLSEAYERQPHSVPNHNGKKVLFASDWGNPTNPVYTYVSGSFP